MKSYTKRRPLRAPQRGSSKVGDSMEPQLTWVVIMFRNILRELLMELPNLGQV